MSFLRNLRARFTRSPAAVRVMPDAPLAYYLHPNGKTTPIGTKSYGFDNWYGTNPDAGLTPNYSSPGLAIAYVINVWVNRCVEIRGNAIARLDWYVEDVRTGKRIEDHDFIAALRTSRRNILKLMSSGLDIWGECYIKPLENIHGYYSRMFWMNPTTTQMVITNGRVVQFFYVPTQGGVAVSYGRDEVAYLYTFNPFNDLRGLSKLSTVLEEVQISEEIARTVRSFYAHDARPGLMLIPEHDLDPNKAQEFMDYWKNNFQGSLNANRPVMLPKNIKTIQEMNRSPAQADVDLREAMRREICAAFGIPLSIAGAWDDANYQSAPEQRKSLYEETIIPYAEEIAKMMTEELLPFWDDRDGVRVWFDPSDLLALAEDVLQKTQALSQQLMSGGISVNEYREALRQPLLPPETGNIYYVPTSVIATPAAKLGQMQPSINPFTGMQSYPSAQPALPPAISADQPALPSGVDEATKAGKSVSLLLTLPDNVDLVALQRRLQQLAGDTAIQWNNPADYHITLLTAPNCDEQQIVQLQSALSGVQLPALDLVIGSLNVFDNVGEHALHFRIRRDEELIELQETLYNLCHQIGIQCSSYSNPAAYKPHVTMGYAAQRIKPITFHSKLAVVPDALVMSVETAPGQYKPMASIRANTPAIAAKDSTASAVQLTWMDELDAWQKFSINRIGKASRAFECRVLPDDVQALLTTLIADASTKRAINTAFDVAREYVKKKADEPVYITPEQALEWWRDYDVLMNEIGSSWLRDYMQQAWAILQSDVSPDLKPKQVEKALTGLHTDIIESWVGTVDQPGVLARLMMAGMAVGQRALVNQRTNLNPNKAELNIDWELVPEDALAFVRKYAFGLIKEIDDTTVKEVQDALVKWLESGGSLAELETLLSQIFNDPMRAELIASTEATRAYQSGAEARWKEAGVKKAKWRTVSDDRVCDICRPLHNVVADLLKGWWSAKLQKHIRPGTAHPGDRCYSTPVLD